MRRTWLFLMAVAAAGCGRDDESGPEPTPDAVTAAPFDGGSAELAGCDYRLTTGIGAQAPVAGSAVLGPAPQPRQVRLGLASDPRTSMVITWRAGDELTLATSARFAVGADLGEDQLTERRDGLTFLYQGGFSNLAAEQVRIHEVHLCGLQPDTTYSYQVGGDGAWSPVRSFRTAPDVAADPSAEVAIAFVGDSRGGYAVWAELVAELERRAPDLILFSGDAVTFGAVQDEWDEFFGRGESLLARVPMVSAHGNHEGNVIGYYSQLAMPGDEQNFAIDYGHAHVTVLNDNPPDESVLATTSKDFLAADLGASDARWKLVMHHRPQWSSSAHHGSDALLAAMWGPIIDQHRADLVLSGHEHHYERTVPLRAGAEVAAGEGAVYVVSGGAGAPLYQSGTSPFTAKAETTHGAVMLRVRRDQLSMEAFRLDGSVLDTLALTKP